MDRDLVEFVVIDQLVPKEHLLRKIDAAVDFTQLYEMVEPLYCEDNGRPSIDPVVLFKMVLIQHLYGLPSLRRTADEVSANICYRWFLGYTLQEETPHFSTVSYNFRHRFTEETVDRVFAWILDEAAKAGYREPDEAQPYLLERGWSKQSGSSACAASYRQTPACSERLGGAQKSGGQRFDRDAAAFCREVQQAG